MKKSSKAIHVIVSLFLSCVSSISFSGVAMVPKSIYEPTEYTKDTKTLSKHIADIIDSDIPLSKFMEIIKEILPDLNKKLNEKLYDDERLDLAMIFYFILFKGQEYLKITYNFILTYNQPAIDYLPIVYTSIHELLYSGFVFNYLCAHLSSLDFKEVAEKFRNEGSGLLYQRILSYLVYSYEILEDLGWFIENHEISYSSKDALKKVVSSLSKFLEDVISNENIVNYTNQTIELHNNYSTKNWPLFNLEVQRTKYVRSR